MGLSAGICRVGVIVTDVLMDDIKSFFGLLKVGLWSSSPGEFHPQALTDRYVTVSCHTAPASIYLETSRSQAYPEKSGSSQLTG